MKSITSIIKYLSKKNTLSRITMPDSLCRFRIKKHNTFFNNSFQVFQFMNLAKQLFDLVLQQTFRQKLFVPTSSILQVPMHVELCLFYQCSSTMGCFGDGCKCFIQKSVFEILQRLDYKGCLLTLSPKPPLSNPLWSSQRFCMAWFRFFTVVPVTQLLTTCLVFDNPMLDIFDAGGPQCHFITSILHTGLGVGRFFSGGTLVDFPNVFLGGGKSGEICFFPFESKKTTFF